MRKREFISYKESINKLKSLSVREPLFEKIPLMESRGRVLFEDTVAESNSPEFPTSSLDGFAIKATDQKRDFIDILGDNPAGTDISDEVVDGKTIKTFTGSLMPKGSDTLIQIENVRVEDNRLYIEQPVSIGNGIRPVGEVYRKGDVLIKKGTVIDFAEIGVLAGLNMSYVKVALKPKVAILSTGSEVLELGEERKSRGEIRSSNNYTLQALTEKFGGEAIQLGAVKDDFNSTLKAFQNGLDSGADIIVSTGGVSVGDYDFVQDIIPKLGAEVIFHGVKIKPGQHIMVAQKEKQVIIALPGFAYSSTVTFILYTLPLLKRILGQKSELYTVQGVLSQKFYKRSKKTEFTPCSIEIINGEYRANFDNKKVGTSAILTNMLDSANLIVTDENSEDREIGEKVDIILL